METLFLFCAAIGGTIMAFQFVMTLVGLGGAEGDFDVDVPDDFDADLAHAGDSHLGHVGHDHGSTWLFGVLSFRTLVAAVTFFGLLGLTANAADMSVATQLILALLGGLAAMYGVHWIMMMLKGLGSDGTLRIQRAIGRTGTVYIPIPPHKQSAGKIQLKIQEQLIDYPAMTAAGEKLPTGAKVVVVGLIGQGTLEVEPVREMADSADR
jgi:membrane protein implicated in regulation of membrane protease activity